MGSVMGKTGSFIVVGTDIPDVSQLGQGPGGKILVLQ